MRPLFSPKNVLLAVSIGLLAAPVVAQAADPSPAGEGKKRVEGQPPARPPDEDVIAGEEAGLPVRVPARPSREAQGLAGVGLKAEEVNAAIDRGGRFLWQLLKQYRGELDDRDSLAFLALVHAGMPKRIPECDQAVRKHLDALEPGDPVNYEKGILCLLIDAYGDMKYLPKLEAYAMAILEGQGQEGTWSYRSGIGEEELGEAVKAHAGDPLGPWKRTRPWEAGDDGDNSVSQYALMGLDAGVRRGMKISSEVWSRNLDAQRRRQTLTGGWGYQDEQAAYGSMTCSGIYAVAIDRFHLGEKDPADDAAIEKGLGWMERFFSVIENPRGGEWHFYYLYALERVGRALDTEFIGSREWYPLGARYLVDAQGKDGGWAEGGYEGPVWKAQAASYALLFLTRATPSLVSAPKAAPPPGGKGLLQAAAGPGRPVRAYIILDASGSMLSPMDGRPKVDIARDVVAGIVQDLPEGSQVALRVYGHTKRAIEEGADEDTALEIPLEPLDRAAFLAKVRSLRARGKTPLALSLRQAAADLSGAGEGDPITVVLLTDGGEDTQPRQDPLAAAEEIGGIDNLKVHVVGFDIGRTDWARELAGITRKARGRYWPAPKAAELRKDLRALILGQPEGFLVLDRERRIVERGAFGQPKELPVGTYTLQTEVAGQVYEQPFSIGAGRTSPLAFDPSKMVKAPQGAAPPAAVPAPEAGEKPPAPGAEPAGGAGQKAPAARKFCSGCGTALKPEWKFCGKCGAKL